MSGFNLNLQWVKDHLSYVHVSTNLQTLIQGGNCGWNLWIWLTKSSYH